MRTPLVIGADLHIYVYAELNSNNSIHVTLPGLFHRRQSLVKSIIQIAQRQRSRTYFLPRISRK